MVFWEAKSGRCYRTIQYPDSHVNRLEITPDKRFLAAAGNPHIRLFDVNSNSPQPVTSCDSHTANVMAVGFQCDGNWMYSGSEDGTVKIWDLRSPGCQREYESRAAVNTVVLHPNQTELISGDQNGNIRVWDLTANSCSCELVPEVDTAVRSLTVMWDGSLVVAANNHGTCYVWRLLRGNQLMTDTFSNVFFHLNFVNLTGHQRWLLLIPRQDSGPCQLAKTLGCIKVIIRQLCVVHSMTEQSLLHVKP
ncbi:Target of rapamycin complex subunit LST8-1 [Turnera subulata]|uniref:Target of rapamycin complex subunit LST8 n=1 Tax=Turnera subulata TaxID=218843 RepID=A0A9Q0J617_9ROSI|nr:Target of rapamycin complex subunit LST8-1 [Turnera subulata]